MKVCLILFNYSCWWSAISIFCSLSVICMCVPDLLYSQIQGHEHLLLLPNWFSSVPPGMLLSLCSFTLKPKPKAIP